MTALRRRDLLKAAITASVLSGLRPRRARAQAMPKAQRAIFFYFPDGVAAESASGEPSLWHCSGDERSYALSEQLSTLAVHKRDCIFFNGLSMGATDAGSHPGGAKKVLTAADGGNGESIDQLLARTAGSSAPYRHLLLGAMANQNTSADKYISYPSAGQSLAPEDDPVRAFDRVFTSSVPPDPSGPAKNLDVSVIDGILADMNAFRARIGSVERAKLDRHLDSLREVETRIKANAMNPDMPMPAACTSTRPTIASNMLYEPGHFPEILRLQIDLMVEAMACNLTRVGTLQGSQHTSELIMSRFVGTEMYDSNFDMRSHQASHYGAMHDRTHREFKDYVAQRRWWVSQFSYLLDQLAARPEPTAGVSGTMLENSVVLLCTEVCDGNQHLFDNMPFVLAGRAGGLIETDRLLAFSYERHARLLIAIAHAMGEPLASFGDSGDTSPLPGVLS